MKVKLPAMGDPIGAWDEIVSFLHPVLDILFGNGH
jgi:hypothetical protein